MQKYIPYTYLIGWRNLDKWYYGCEYSIRKPANPENLWTNYFTSSKVVQEFVRENGPPDVIRVHKIFTDKKSAVVYETKFLTKVQAAQKDKWLNRHNGGKRFYSKSYKRGFTRSLESKQKQGISVKQNWESGLYKTRKSLTVEQHKKRIEAIKGFTQSETQRTKARELKQKEWDIQFPDGHVETIINLTAFCRKLNLHQGNLTTTQHYLNRYCKGYRVAAKRNIGNLQCVSFSPL